jgi:hypothetical protein
MGDEPGSVNVPLDPQSPLVLLCEDVLRLVDLTKFFRLVMEGQPAFWQIATPPLLKTGKRRPNRVSRRCVEEGQDYVSDRKHSLLRFFAFQLSAK